MSFLNDLPSKGFFANATEKVVLKPEGEAPTYLAFHDAKAPEPQIVSTDKTNILIRSLLLRRQRQNLHESGAQSSSGGHGSQDRSGRNSRSSSGKKRPQEAELPQTDSRKRAHIYMPSTPGESAGCPTMGGASGAGYSVAMTGGSCRSDEHEASSSKAMEGLADSVGESDEGMEVDAQNWADSSIEDHAQDAGGVHSTSACSKASTDEPEEGSEQDEEDDDDDIFRSPDEKDCSGSTDVHASSVSSPGASAGLQAQKIAALREKCRQMGIPSQGKKEALVTRILGCSQ